MSESLRPTSPSKPTMTAEEIEAGKTFAILAWAGMLMGVPLFIVPLIQRDNAFALFHAKHAGTTFLASLVLVVGFMVIYVGTCGLGALMFPVLFLTLIPVIDGFVKAVNGKAEAPMLIGDFTDRLFGGLTVDAPKAKPTPAKDDTEA